MTRTETFIEGSIRKVISHKPSGWNPAGTPFLIAALGGGEKVMGEMARPEDGDVKGERVRFYGGWRPDRRDPTEMIFAFDHHEVMIEPSADGVADYLGRHVPGVGKVKAYAMVAHFGAECLHVLRTDGARAAECPGIDARLAGEIADHFAKNTRIDPAAYARLVTLLGGYKVPRKLITKLLEDWGSDAPAIVKANPYLLLAYPRIGWDMADEFAIKSAGYAPDGPARQQAAIVEALSRATDNGHTIAPRIEVESAAFGLIGLRPSADAWAALVEAGRVAVSDGPAGPGAMVAPPKLDAAERYIAGRLARLSAAARPLPIEPDAIEGLTPDQREAARLILGSGVAILAGGPGTGKTTTVSLLIRAAMDAGVAGIRILAPTGKAAKRAEELVRKSLGGRAASVPCTTIHKALGIAPGDDDEGVPQASAKVGRGRPQFGFEHGEANPLEGRIFIVDECSMVDVSLMAAVTAAVPLGGLLLIVGDADQLPSVGPGSVLRDLIAAGIPTATLTEILRSDGGGTVVRACHAIRQGRTPEPAERLGLPTENWVHVEARSPSAIADAIVTKVAQVQAGSKLGLDPTWDVQVISAQYGIAEFGCDALNERLSAQLNPTPGPTAGDSDDLRFKVGDKVIRRKNGKVDELKPCMGGRADWEWAAPYGDRVGRWSIEETTVVNGDMGVVEGIVFGKGSAHVVVRFRNPDRLCRLPMGSCHLKRAYAITVHSSQGSGYPYVIVPIHPSFYFNEREGQGIWCRELIYTAMSRAETILVTVGDLSSIRTAVGRRTLHKRRTRLAERIVAALRARGESEAAAATAAADAEAIEAAHVDDVAVAGPGFDPIDSADDFTIPSHATPTGPREMAGATAGGRAGDDPYDFGDLPF